MSTQRQESERRDDPAHHLINHIFQSLTTDVFFCFVYFTVFLYLRTIKFEGLYTSADKGDRNDRTYTC